MRARSSTLTTTIQKPKRRKNGPTHQISRFSLISSLPYFFGNWGRWDISQSSYFRYVLPILIAFSCALKDVSSLNMEPRPLGSYGSTLPTMIQKPKRQADAPNSKVSINIKFDILYPELGALDYFPANFVSVYFARFHPVPVLSD